MARKPLLWLTACCAVGLGIARGATAQDASATAIHDLTVTGCLEQTRLAAVGTSGIDGAGTPFRLTHAVTVVPDADRRTGFSSAKTSTPVPAQAVTVSPDQYRLAFTGRPDRHVGQEISAIGTLKGSQLRLHHIRTISLTCS